MNKRKLGIALQLELEKGYNVQRISHWAFQIFSNNSSSLNSEEREWLERLFSMQDDPQFEYTEKELISLSIQLIREGEKEALSFLNGDVSEKAEVLNEAKNKLTEK